MISFTARRFEAANDLDRYTDENDSRWIESRVELPLRSCAFLLMDVWHKHPNDGWRIRGEANIQNFLSPLLQRLRVNSATILHAYHGQPQHPLALTCEREWDLHRDQLETADALVPKLREHNIENIFYAGYVSNWCILNRDVGLINLKRNNFNVYLIRDCSIAFETSETLEGEWCHKVIVNTIEHQWGQTLRSTDILLPNEIRSTR